jgi:copper chaperone
MTDQVFKFKTTIKCGGCIAKVSPYLNGCEGLLKWEVDTNVQDKILTVDSNGISKEEVMGKVREAGFKIESIEG